MKSLKKLAGIFMSVLVAVTSITVTICPKSVQAAYTEKSGYVTGDNVNVRTGPGTENISLTKLSTGHEVRIKGEAKAANGAIWYLIWFTKNGSQMEGYMHSDYVRVAFTPSDTAEDADYELYLEKQGFPESYRRYLRVLHQQNPLWIFVALPTGIEWENAVAGESKLGTNLVPQSSITSFKSLANGAINWDTGSWNGFDGASWVAASKSVIRYYLDPRNFLTGEKTILQFESLYYEEGVHTVNGVENILKGTHMEGGEFAAYFMGAGKAYNISPYHLAARARQETGVNGSNSTKPQKDAAYAEFNGYYNFFNIGASPNGAHDAMYNGLARAKAEGWDTPQKSIYGGAQIIASRYIARGQSTLYLQKFDVVDGGDGYYAHQYMTNLLAASSEAKLMESTYSDFRAAAITFSVPVYLNMPDTPAPCPTDNGSPYSVLSDLNISGMEFEQMFDDYTFQYTAAGETSEPSVQVNAAAYAPDAVISGNGVVQLAEGRNVINVQCTGRDGSVRTYSIVVNRKRSANVKMGDVNKDNAVNSIDALLVLRASVEAETLTEEQIQCADVNKNGIIDADDALLILQYVTGVVESL